MRDRPAFRIKPEILKTSEIQNRAEQLTLAYAEQVGLDAARLGISFQVVYEELIYPDFGIELQEGLDLGFDDAGKKIFGQFLPAENIVQIDRIISHDHNHPQRVSHTGTRSVVMEYCKANGYANNSNFVVVQAASLPRKIH